MADRTERESQRRVDDPAPIIAREGWVIVAGFVIGAVGLTWFVGWGFGPVAGWVVGVITGALALWCVWFFRDPARRVAGLEAGRRPVVSPADGVVCGITRAFPPAELEVPFDQASRMTRVSIFMNVFNVHVNRSPVDAAVVAVRHHPGKFFNASFDKASEHNERLGLRLRLGEEYGGVGERREMACVQIAGLIARRIVCRVKEGATLRAGERFGIIRFGSRVDVYLPDGVAPGVKVGDRAVAGETVLAWLEPAVKSAPGAGAGEGAAANGKRAAARVGGAGAGGA